MAPAFPLFLFLVIASASVIEWAIVKFAFTGMLAVCLMWSVGVSAILALKLTGRDLANLGWKWGAARYHLIALILPMIYGGAACLVANAAGLAKFPRFETLTEIAGSQGFASLAPATAVTALLFLAATAGLVNNMAAALGEEIGWRGFLTPRLVGMTGFLSASLITGVFWTAWHLPILLYSGYNAGGEKLYEIVSFLFVITAISGALAWLRLASGSLWPAVTMHASHNLVLQTIFDPMTVRGESPITMVGEFGVVTAGVCILVCLPLWIAGARRMWRTDSLSV